MIPKSEDPARARRATGSLLNASSSAADCLHTAPNTAPKQAEILRNPLAVAAMRRELNLEFLHECAGGISVHAELIKTFAEIGDVAGACYALKRLFAHAKCAHPVYVELRDGIASIEEHAT